MPADPNFDEALQQYYQILRCRQSQIIGIIKETSEFAESLEARPTDEGFDKNSDRKLKLAFSMINALANLLDEQMNALDIWERVLSIKQTPAQHQTSGKNSSRNDFEIALG